MKVEINLTNEFIDNLLKRFGYKRDNIRVGYTIYAYSDDELRNHLECVSYYNQDIAYKIDDKPEFLNGGLVTTSMVEPYELDKVVNELFNMALAETIGINIF